ncbi:MAG TPA: hypothetical protein VEP48_08580 [Methylomirabilota bacterium]|nr:hypothetical protein [Methylomirabilota bacterium]
MRQQYMGQVNVSPFPVQCDQYVDWHMYNSGHYWQIGTDTCL